MLVGWGTTGRTDAVPPRTQRGGIGGETTGWEAPRKDTARDGHREPVGVGTGESNPREEGRQQMKQGAPPRQPSYAAVIGDAVQTGPAAQRVTHEGHTGGTHEEGDERPANTSTGEQTPTERGCRTGRLGEERASVPPRQLFDAVALGAAQKGPVQMKTPVPGDTLKKLPAQTGMPEKRQGAMLGGSNPVEGMAGAENSPHREEPVGAGTPPKAQGQNGGANISAQERPPVVPGRKTQGRYRVL